jgi:chorismate mutase / prephenate dehydratase
MKDDQNQPTVAYLGPEGTYSEEAAHLHYGKKAIYEPKTSIDEAVRAVESKKADAAVVPIENSTEGAVKDVYDDLLQTSLQICGEILLPIHHQLQTKAHSLVDIQEVVAHPQSLAQCRAWLDKHIPSVKRIPVVSNAEAARLAAKNETMAAIASETAAHIYQLPILEKDIEDDPSNTTRFVILGTTETQPSGSDKTSLVCSTPDKPGALYKVLGVLAEQGINMVKLESRLARGSLTDYIFFIDIEGHKQESAIASALESLKTQTIFLKILGSYPKGA